jgi:methylglutamate dehydrogenase subunit A
MSEPLPQSAATVIVGAGVHGLSTAWHLAMELQARRKGEAAKDIVVLDKAAPGAGASGIACGLLRGFYMTDALHPIIRHSYDVWTYDRVTFGFQQVGYVSCGELNQLPDYERIHRSQNANEYPSDLYTGKEAHAFLRKLWPDINTNGIEVVLHEKASGYSGTRQAIRGLAEKCVEHGARIFSGVEVTGYEMTNGRVSKVRTNRGDIACDNVVLGLGAWTPHHWELLGLPATLDYGYADGSIVKGKDMWTFWRLREAEVYLDAPYLTPEKQDPPIFKAELMNTPVTDGKGRQLGDYTYVYWKYAAERTRRPGLQGGGVPVKIGPQAQVDPYGHASELYPAEPDFADYFCAAMAERMGRFKDIRGNFVERSSGGIGAFTPDNLPIFDWVRPNVYMIADSNHGYKMTGVGKLVARHLASGRSVAELTPFGFDRFAAGRTFGKTNSHSPWV